LKNIKVEFGNNHHMLFVLNDVASVRKTKFLILFASLMNIE
jgi:hypothetical protein